MTTMNKPVIDNAREFVDWHYYPAITKLGDRLIARYESAFDKFFKIPGYLQYFSEQDFVWIGPSIPADTTDYAFPAQLGGIDFLKFSYIDGTDAGDIVDQQ